jgi:hypothetical protein
MRVERFALGDQALALTLAPGNQLFGLHFACYP